MKILLNLVINAIAVFIAANILPGIKVDGFATALVVALVLGVVNILVKPFVILLTLPINVLTLGLFTLVINAVMILLVSSLVQGFKVNDLLSALIFSLVLSVISSILQSLT